MFFLVVFGKFTRQKWNRRTVLYGACVDQLPAKNMKDSVVRGSQKRLQRCRGAYVDFVSE